MPLKKIDLPAGNVVQVCAGCGAEHTLPVSSLRLGVVGVLGNLRPNQIELPRCTCGAQELLLRTWDKVDGPHRRAVNALAAKLRADGQYPSELASVYTAELAAESSPTIVGEPVMEVDLPAATTAPGVGAQPAAQAVQLPAEVVAQMPAWMAQFVKPKTTA